MDAVSAAHLAEEIGIDRPGASRYAERLVESLVESVDLVMAWGRAARSSQRHAAPPA